MLQSISLYLLILILVADDAATEIVGKTSLSVIVVVAAEGVPKVQADGLLKVAITVSLPSTNTSFTIVTLMVSVDLPAGKRMLFCLKSNQLRLLQYRSL